MRHTLIYSTAIAVLALAAVSIRGADDKSKSKETQYGNADSINEQELKIYDYFLASDQLEGRNFPSRGYDTAALYIASHLAEWGLKPGGSPSGTNGPLQPYLLPIEMVSKQVVPEESKLSLTGGGGGRGPQSDGRGNAEQQTSTFEYGKDWTAGSGRGGGSVQALDVSANLVFAGNGYVINKTKTNPYDGLDVRGKIIVVAGVPPELAAQQGTGRGGRGGEGRGGRGGRGGENAGQAGDANNAANAQETGAGGRGAAENQNPLGEDCVDYLTPEEYAAKNGALGVVTVAGFQQAAAMGNGRGNANPNGPAYQVVKFQPACPTAPAVTAGIALTNALFQGEKSAGAVVFDAAGNNLKLGSFELNARKKLSLKIGVRSQSGHGEDVVGIVEGSDPVLKNEFVIMSAHLDHLGLSAPQADGHNVNNGADDDGSGSTGLLALAHSFAEGAAKGMRPKRSVMFLWNGGEEKGLWGSRYFTEFPPFELSRVVADLNIDMIGRSKNPKSVDNNPTHYLVEHGEVFLVGPRISSDDLGKLIGKVNANTEKLKINDFYDTTAPDETHDNLGPQGRGQRIFYRSDHYNFAKMGIPIAFFTTGLHVDYHRPTDTPEKIDYAQIQIITKLVAATGWELANQDGRPKLKADLPEQLVKDMKTARDQGWGKVTPVLEPLPGMPY